MNNLVQQYYPEPAILTYLYLRSFDQDVVENNDKIIQEHLKDLEVSGFIKLNGDKIQVREDGRWLCDPPEVKVKERKQPFKNPRLDQLADIVGYPIDWHKRAKYEGLYRSMAKKHSWETLLEVAKYFKENKTKPELVLNYFLSGDGFKGIKYHMDNPKNKEEPQILFRGDITKDQDSQECLF